MIDTNAVNERIGQLQREREQVAAGLRAYCNGITHAGYCIRR